MFKLFNVRMLNFCRPTTWCVQKNLHMTCLKHKKRKTAEEKKNPKPVVYGIKSKFKQSEAIEVWKNMTMNELATALGKDINHVLDVMTFLDNTAHYRKPQQIITDYKVIEDVVRKSGKRCKLVGKPVTETIEDDFKDVTRRDPSTYLDVRPRPPVITIMGHVDHGKTTLLDTLRSSAIVASEFGGITQHIGAFSVLLGKDTVTFLDTPGHAAFCSMRSRGAQCTDIVVLVVAADDGVMEQTIESIRMAKEAEVPIIIALNKIDKPTANIERAKKMLVQHEIQVEEYGGDVQVVPISALKGTNVDTLMEAILVQAELMELKSDYSGPVEGVVIESSTDVYRGKLSTILIQCGTLKKGNILVAGTAWGKVRALFNDQGQPVQNATPSTPVECLGWKALPSPGDVIIEVTSEKIAAQIVEFRENQLKKEKQMQDLKAINEKEKEHLKKYKEMLEHKRKLGRFRLKPDGPRQKLYQPDDTIKLNIIIKGDVDGSVEAILDVIDTYNSDKCKLNVIHYGVGPVSQNDVLLAETFNAVIYAFNTKKLPDISYHIKPFNVIYKLVDDIKTEINKLLPEKDVEEVIGEANVLQEFIINEGKNKVPVAGCRCTKGVLKKASGVKLVRNGEVVYDGNLKSLRHLKDEVDTIKKDVECGIRLIDTSVNFKQGDTLVCYKINKVKQEIDWDPGF